MRRSDRAIVATRLISAMQRLGLTQHQLAEQSGVSQGTISGLVNQKRSLSKQSRVRTNRTLRSLAAALGEQPTYFENSPSTRQLTFGQAIRAARLRLGLSQVQLGELTHIPASTLSLLERDKVPEERVQTRWRNELIRELGLPDEYGFNVLADEDTPPAILPHE